MDLPSLCGSGRVCTVAGKPYLVRPLSLDARGSVLAWLDDTMPGRDDRAMPPQLSDPGAWEAIEGDAGMMLLVYLGLREHGISLDDACRLVPQMSQDERTVFRYVTLNRRRTFRPDPGNTSLSSFWWGPSAISLIRAYPGLTFEALGRMTIDQLDCLATEGLESERPCEASTEITEEDPHAILARLRAENPGEFCERLDEMLGTKNGEAS